MVDYSKWAKIEVSDDEDDTHPNIDTGSLFRWRHQAREDRMLNLKSKRADLESTKAIIKKELDESRKKFEAAQSMGVQSSELTTLNDEFNLTKNRYDEIIIQEANLLKEEKSQAWNVDTISNDGFDYTKTNSFKEDEKKDFNIDSFSDYVKRYAKELKYFGMLDSNANSREYLIANIFLLSEDASAYLCIWAVDLIVEEKWKLYERVAHQATVLNFLLQLRKSMNIPNMRLVQDFYMKINKNEKDILQAFNSELESFKIRAKERAKVRIETAAEEEQEERIKRLGPGGLDPHEVFESLPDRMKECFEKRDIELLKTVIMEMDQNEAAKHMKRCIDSGLWNPAGPDLETD